MQFEIFLTLCTLNFLTIATQNAAKQHFEKYSTSSDKSNIEETPSPEWIKYQQERFQNVDQLTTTRLQVSKGSPSSAKSPSFAQEAFGQWQTTSRRENSQNHQEIRQQTEYENSNLKDSGETFAETTSSAVEFPSIKGFIEFIKSIKQTWMNKSLLRIEDKIKMLHKLKDALLKTIENQFKILWQDDNDDDDEDEVGPTQEKLESSKHNHGSHLRRKRGILDQSSINFPPDAALISINFLTFAVFLIKLVLQVVNIIKTKHYQFSTLNVDTGAIRNG